jgi:tRNA pseudouridine38-40 synthase
VGSGRTDAGVHAQAQVAHVRTRNRLPAERIVRSVNALLPKDIVVLRVSEAPRDFHARFSARRKSYRYRVFTGAAVPPFIAPYVHQVRWPLDVARMRREAAALAGRHDFRALAQAGHGRHSSVRRLSRVAVTRRGEELQIDLTGDGFLHAMARSIAGTLIDVGRGRLPEGSMRRLLRTGRRSLAGTTAPAKGLTLVHVEYP